MKDKVSLVLFSITIALIIAFGLLLSSCTPKAFGEGGQVYNVSSLDELRNALNTPGPRIVLFDTLGEIHASSPIYVTEPYVTLDGRGMVTITGSPIFVRTHDVEITGMIIRPGDGPGANPTDRDSLTLWGDASHDVYNVYVHHNSLTWAMDEVFSTWGPVHDVEVAYNIIAEGLDNSIDGVSGGTGMLIGANAYDISIHHNLIAFNDDRNPAIFGPGRGEFVNNVVYGWGIKSVNPRGGGGLAWHFLGNYCKAADYTKGWHGEKECFQLETPGQYYFDGNNSGITNRGGTIVDAPLFDSMEYTDADTAYADVLENAGASPRDEVDQRIVENVRNEQGKIISSQDEVIISDFSGVPFGPFDYVPDANHAEHPYTLTRTNYRVFNLQAVKAQGMKAFVAVTGSKSNYYTNGCFDLEKWKDEFDSHIDGLQPFVDDGTIIGLYAIDEPDDEACGPTYEELNEVCKHAHEGLPGIACGFNTEAEYLAQGRDLIPEIDYIFDQTNFGKVGNWGGWAEWAEAQFADAWWFDGPIYLSINAYT